MLETGQTPSRAISITPDIERLIALGAPVAFSVSGGKDGETAVIECMKLLDRMGNKGEYLNVVGAGAKRRLEQRTRKDLDLPESVMTTSGLREFSLEALSAVTFGTKSKLDRDRNGPRVLTRRGISMSSRFRSSSVRRTGL